MKSTSQPPGAANAVTFVADDLKQLLDRPIAYQRIFSHLTGDPITALFLSQALHWTPRTNSDDGFFYKTQADWWTETGLTRYHQETARRKLRKLGILEEKLKGIPAQLYFKLDLDRLAELLKALINGREHSQTSVVESNKQARGKTTNKTATKPQTIKTKTSAKKTTKTTTSDDVVSLDSLAEELTAQGVSKSRARTLAKDHPDEMRRRLEMLPHIELQKSAAAFLSARPHERWSEPKEISQAASQTERDEGARRAADAARQRATDERAQIEHSTAENQNLMEYFQSLPPAQKRKIEAAARQRCGPVAALIGDNSAALGAEIRNQIRELLKEA